LYFCLVCHPLVSKHLAACKTLDWNNHDTFLLLYLIHHVFIIIFFAFMSCFEK
jgi:hypothetical protein